MKKLIPILLILAACTTDPVFMRHPETGQTVQCGPYDSGGVKATAAALHEAQCIQDYKEQGFVRVPSNS